MSRTVARIINGFADVVTLPMSKRQKDRTRARVSEFLMKDNVRTVSTVHGKLKFYALRGAAVASAIDRFHQDEPETFFWIDEYVQPGDTMWDIGANIGLYSLYAAQKPDVTVYAFEPSGLNFSLLVEHVMLNHADKRIYPFCMALSDTTKIDHLHMGDFSTGHASNAFGVAQNQFEEFAPAFSQAVPGITVDGFCKLFGCVAPDHIKLDVDGIESLILAGATKTLKKVKTITIEVEGQNAELAEEMIEKPLFKAGFKEKTVHREKGSCRNRLYIKGI